MYFVYPPKICIAIVSSFSWVLKSSQEKSKTMIFHFFFFGGGGKGGKQVVLLCMWKGSQGTSEQIGCKKSRSRSYAAGSRLFRLSSMCPGSLKAAPQRRLGSFRILVIKHLGLEGKLASFPKQALLQNPPGQLKFRSIARPTIWLLLVACIARFLKELVINNYGKRMKNKINEEIKTAINGMEWKMFCKGPFNRSNISGPTKGLNRFRKDNSKVLYCVQFRFKSIITTSYIQTYWIRLYQLWDFFKMSLKVYWYPVKPLSFYVCRKGFGCR